MSDETTTEAPDLDMPAIAPPDDAVIGDDVPDVGANDGPVYRRSISEGTRKLFAGASKRLAEQIAAGDGDEDEPAIKPPDDKPAAAAGAAPASSAAPTALPPAAAAPALDAATNRKALELDVREKSIADRETKLAERERAGTTVESFASQYGESPSAAVKTLLKSWTGIEADEDMRDEVADLITDLSVNVLGLPVSNEVKARTDARRAVRTVKAYKAEQAKKDADAQKRAETDRATAEQQGREQLARNALATELKSGKGEDGKAHAERYPHLMAEDDPHDIVWDVIKTKLSREPNWTPNWVEAAKLADDHFRAQHEKLRAKVNRLPTPATQPAAAVVHQGAAQSRAARTLTNASTAPLPRTTPNAEQPLDEDAPYDKHKARSRSLGKLREAMEKRTT